MTMKLIEPDIAVSDVLDGVIGYMPPTVLEPVRAVSFALLATPLSTAMLTDEQWLAQLSTHP